MAVCVCVCVVLFLYGHSERAVLMNFELFDPPILAGCIYKLITEMKVFPCSTAQGVTVVRIIDTICSL